MKCNLTIFILSLIAMCSIMLSSQIKSKTNIQNKFLSKMQSKITSKNKSFSEVFQIKKSKNGKNKRSNKNHRNKNTLKAGDKIYSKNLKYTLTMDRENCQLILRDESKNKNIFSTQQFKTEKNCNAVLKYNGNLEILSSKKTIMWSTNTALSFKGKGPFRLYINKVGNILIKNKKKICVWASFGCPVPKKIINKVKKLKPSKAAILLQKRMEKVKKRLNGLPIRPLPRARGKPVIKNQIPVTLRNKKPKKLKITPLINKKKITFLKRIINKGPLNEKSLKKLLRIIPVNIKRKKGQIKKLKDILKKGKLTYADLRRKALMKINMNLKKIVKKIKLNKKLNKFKKSNKKRPNIKTKSQLKNNIKKQPWFKSVIKAIKAGVPSKKVKAMLIKSANIKGKKTFWRKIAKAVVKKNIQKIVRLVSLPVRKPFVWKKPIYYPPKKKWVLRSKNVKTWRWAWTWRYYWARRCSGRWFWRRCNWVRQRGTYYAYRYYYWTTYKYWSLE